MKARILAALAVLSVVFLMVPSGASAKKHDDQPQKIIYIPHDNRPISDKQTVEVVQKLGYDIVVPPDNLLGDRQNLGDPDKLWQWLDENSKDANAAVISADSMLYGSLVGSRKHEYSEKQVLARADEFQDFRKEHPKMQLYVFSSIMRTPRSGEASGHEEPAYYRSYGSDIFRYTELEDKDEMEGLSYREQKEFNFLKELIPRNDLSDWLDRRQKNFAANERLIQLTRQNTFDYLAIGRDDNAPYSRTHMESRHLAEEGKDIDQAKFQDMAGIDEIGMLLLSRSVNAMKGDVPFVFTRYNWGRGEYTVPSYSDERISDSIRSAIKAGGGMPVSSPKNADLVLVVNTNPNGATYEASDRSNDGTPIEGTKYVADIIGDYVKKGYPVAVADISYANGSDNALMEELKNDNLLFKIRAYAGWNTPTNSTGFVIGEGMLTKYMTRQDMNDLLLTRYLDDWLYQANVRNIVARQLTWLRGDGVYGSLDSKRDAVSDRASSIMTRFVKENLPPAQNLEDIRVTFPWNRMFESDITHGAAQEENFFQAKK